MAISGGAMPASLIEMRSGVPSVVRTESRLGDILVQDLDIAETEILSGVQVWIPSNLFVPLKNQMKRGVQ